MCALKPSRGRRFAAALGTLLAVVLLGGCDRGAEGYYGTVKPRHPPDELWANLGTEPEWIDPNKASDSPGGAIIQNVFSGLVEPHPKTLEPMPALARSWRVSEDGKVWTFYLRPSVWNDGTPLTAHDFEYSWKRLLDPATASKYAQYFWDIEGGKAFTQRALWVPGTTEDRVRRALPNDLAIGEIEGAEAGSYVYLADDAARERATAALKSAGLDATITNAERVGVEAVDALTFRVRLEHPVPYFLQKLAFYVAQPVPRHLIERLKQQGLNEDLWTRPEHIVTNGAFSIAEWKFRQYVILEKNPRYWDAETVKLDRVRLSMVDSYNTTLNLYEAGELDWIGENASLPAEFVDHLSQFRDFHHSPWLGTYFYWLNTKAPPLDDPKVRQALALAIDRKSLVEHITRGQQIPTASLVPDAVAGYQGLGRPTFDPKRARQLLAEAGYPKGRGLPRITLIYNTSEGHKQIAEAVQHMWREQLGVDIAIENQEWKVYLKNLQLMNFQIARMGWIGDYPDPYTFLEILLSESGNNHSGYASRKYDELLERANATIDQRQRLALLRQAETVAMDAQPIIPVYVYSRLDLWKPYVRGLWGNIQNKHPLKWISIDRRFYDGVPAEIAPEPVPPLRRPEPPPPEPTATPGPSKPVAAPGPEGP